MDKNRLLIKIILTALLILTLAACTGQPAEPTSTVSLDGTMEKEDYLI